MNDEQLHEFITDQLDYSGVDPSTICFEITETAVISNLPKAKLLMERLKTIGCKFSLDDFGNGLSSFGYLKSLPVDYVKIDGVFVRDIGNNAVNRAMVEAIHKVASVMGLKTIAEYVENAESLRIVRELGIDYAQGHGVGLPRPLI